MKFIATIINALAVQRQAEGVSHSANTFHIVGYKQQAVGFSFENHRCDSPQNAGYKQRLTDLKNAATTVANLQMQLINV